MADDKDADVFMLLNFLTVKQHKKQTIWVRHWLLDMYVISTELSLETKPRPKSRPTLSIV